MSVGGDKNYSDLNRDYGDKSISIPQGKTGGTSVNKKKQAQEQSDRDVKTSQRQTQSQIKKGTEQTQTGQQTTKASEQGKQEGTSVTRTANATKLGIGNFDRSTLGKAKGQVKVTGQQINQVSPSLLKPTSEQEVSGEKILQAMGSKGQQTNHVGQAQEQILKSTQNNVGPSGEISKNQQGKLLGTVMQSTLKNLQESTNPPKDPQGTFNEAFNNTKNDRQGQTNLSFNANIDKNIQKQPKETQQILSLMKNNPEFAKFQSSSDVNTFNQVTSQAKQVTDAAPGTYLKSSTQQKDDLGTSKVIKGDQFLTKKLMSNQISQSDFGKLNRVRSGEISENQLKGVAKNGDDLKQVFQDLKKATESPDKKLAGLQNMTPKGVDQDETRVKSAHNFLQGAMNQLKDKSPNLSKNDVLTFIMKPRNMKGISPQDRQNLEKVLGNQFEKNPTSILSLKKAMNFDEGWKNGLTKLVDNKTLTKSGAEIFNNPGSVLGKEKDFTSKLQENMKSIPEQLTKAGMKTVKNSFSDHMKLRNKTSNHVSFLNQLKANGAPAGQINQIMEKLSKGEITPEQAISEIKGRFGKYASSAQQQISVDGGFSDGKSFEIDGMTLQSIAKSMSTPSMKLKMQALSFINEQMSAAKSLLGGDPKTLEAIKSQLPASFPGSPTTASNEQTPPTSEHRGFEMSIGSYITIVGAFNNDVTNMLTEAQISDSKAQTNITIMKNIANQIMSTKAFNAMQEQQDQKSKGPVGNFFADVFGAAKMLVEVSFMSTLMFMSPIGFVIGSAGIASLMSGSVKNFEEGGVNQALQSSFYNTIDTGLKTMGVPPVVADSIATVYSAALIVTVAVTSAALVVLTGGLAAPLVALMIAGTVAMAASSLVNLASQLVGALSEDGVINDDEAQAIEKTLGWVSLSFSLAGMALMLPALIYSLPEMYQSMSRTAKSLAEMVSKIADASMEFAQDVSKSARASLGMVDELDDAFMLAEQGVGVGSDAPKGGLKMRRLGGSLDDAASASQPKIAEPAPAAKAEPGKLEEAAGKQPGDAPGEVGKAPADPVDPSAISPGAPANPSVIDAQSAAQKSNVAEDAEKIVAAENAEQEQASKGIKASQEENVKIASKMDEGSPSSKFEKAYKEGNFDDMSESWKQMDAESKANFRDSLTDTDRATFDKQYRDRLNYEALSDASQERVNKFFGEKDVGARIKSDLDKASFIKKLNLAKEGIDVVKKAHNFTQKLQLGKIRIYNAEHQRNAQVLEAQAKRAESSVKTMDQAMDSIIQDMQGLTSMKKSSAKQTDAFFNDLSNVTTEIAYALTPKS